MLKNTKPNTPIPGSSISSTSGQKGSKQHQTRMICLAIVGKNNEPLYLCDYDSNKEGGDQARDDAGEEDIFGFSEESSKGVENNLTLDKEVCLLLSLNYFVSHLVFPWKFYGELY